MPPQFELHTTFRLVLKRSSICLVAGLVNTSANWSSVEINLTSSSQAATRSLTKWKSISMCLVRAWKTGLAVRYVAPKLSQDRTGTRCWDTPSSLSSDSTQMASAAPFAKALYSASVLDLDTVGCFFELQEMRFGPTNMAKPLVDRRSSGQQRPASYKNKKLQIFTHW